MLSWIAVHVERGRIEHDLESRATRALRKADHGWASIVFSGRDGVLVGTAPRSEAAVEALALAREVWGVRAVEGRTRLVEHRTATTRPAKSTTPAAPPRNRARRQDAALAAKAALPPIAATLPVITGADGHIADARPFTVAATAPTPIAEPRPDAVPVSELLLPPDDEASTDAKKPQEAAPPPNVETAAIAEAVEASTQTCQAAVRAINVTEPVRFDRDKTEIDGHSRGVLERLVATVGSCPNVGLRVVGHADARGRAKRNLVLSERRARAVVRYLIDKGIDAGRLEAVGCGEARPVAPNDTAQNRAKNRRIELEIKSAGPQVSPTGQGAGNGLPDR